MDPRKDEQAPETQSLSEVLSDTYDQLESEMTEEEEIPEESVDDAEEFKAEAEAEEEAEAEAAGESEEPEETEVTEEVTEFNEPAPERWPQEMKDAYNKLPSDIKQIMLEQVFKPMQRTYTQSTQELAEMRSTLNPMLEVMNQHAPALKEAGYEPAEAFRRQVQWAAHFAKVGPEQGIADMQAAYGLQAGGQRQEISEEYQTPIERALKQRLDHLEQHLGQQQQTFTEAQKQQEQQALEAMQNNLRNEIQSFTNETKDGKPAHPHLDKVGARMAGLVRGGLVEKFDEYGQTIPIKQQLASAYALACNMDPSIRTVSPRSTSGQVKQAKRANATLESKGPGSSAGVPDRPISEDISEIYDRLSRKAG